MQPHLQAEVEKVVVNLRMLLRLLPRVSPDVDSVIFHEHGICARVGEHGSLRLA